MFSRSPLLTLAGLTALDTIRQPIILLLTVACVLLTALTPMVLLHTFGEPGKLAREGGLAFHFVFGLLVAVQSAASALARERQSGTAATVLSKPVGRGLFFLAKFTGVALVVLAFSIAASLATLMAERVAERWTVLSNGWQGDLVDWRTGWWLLGAPLVALGAAGIWNFWRRRPFGSVAFLLLLLLLVALLVGGAGFDRAGALAAFDWRVDWRLVPASALMTMALLVLAAVAVSAATRLTAGMAFACCAGLFVLGVLWEYWLGPVSGGGPTALLYGLVPNWRHFWMSDALIGGGTIPWSYVAGVGAYAATYTAAILTLGVLAFQQADV